MKMFIRGEWVDSKSTLEVTNPFDGSVIDTVPKAEASDVDRALAGAAAGAKVMRELPAYERFEILQRAAGAIAEQVQQLGRLISEEEGKTLSEGVAEAKRAAETMQLSAEEAKRLGGEVLPLDGASAGQGTLGFTLRVPCGVVVAITPFNFPLNMPAHKVGPALAAGNSVILKPASDTPLSALRLTKILLEAGIPPLGITCITGSGGSIGDKLCTDQRVRKISFTGSRDIGDHIMRTAGIKRVTLELGSNSPIIVMDDADLDLVAKATLVTGFGNAGQVCISAQRVLAAKLIVGDLLDALKPGVQAIGAGNQLTEGTKMGPMVRETDAQRVSEWIGEAVQGGASIVAGGNRQGTLHEATLLADVKPEMKVSALELFGPAVAVTKCNDLEEAIRLANDTPYGLAASIFTRDIQRAMKFVRQVDSGNLHVNWGPGWRADLMPYGGLKESGIGKEGPKYAVEQMTELKTVIFHNV